jgi:predicted flap endonuclease-1-like 5' DNA nuclease
VAWSIGHSLLSVLVLLLGVTIGWFARDRRQRTTGAKVTGPEPTPPRPQLTPPAPAGVTPTDPPATASGPAPASKRDAAAGDAGEPADEPATLSVAANTRASAPTPPSSAPAPDEQPADSAGATAVTEKAIEPDGVPAVGPPTAPEAEVDRDHVPADSAQVPAQSQSEPDQAVEETGSTPQRPTDRPVADPAVDVATSNPAPTDAPPATSTTLTGNTDALTSEATAAVDARASTDDFRRIQGIGPKVANALAAAGIRSLQHLADTDEATLREAMRQAGVRSASTLSTWPQQARALANGSTPTPAPRTARGGGDPG